MGDAYIECVDETQSQLTEITNRVANGIKTALKNVDQAIDFESDLYNQYDLPTRHIRVKNIKFVINAQGITAVFGGSSTKMFARNCGWTPNLVLKHTLPHLA